MVRAIVIWQNRTSELKRRLNERQEICNVLEGDDTERRVCQLYIHEDTEDMVADVLSLLVLHRA